MAGTYRYASLSISRQTGCDRRQKDLPRRGRQLCCVR